MADPDNPPNIGDEEEDDDVAMLEADHPAMARVQAALQRQLTQAYEVKAQKFSEQSEQLTREKQRREDTGVQLYQVQQQLAKLQMNLEKVHENYSLISQMREASEKNLQEQRGNYSQAMKEIKGHRNTHAKHQAELDQLQATLKQVEAYNEQMKSEIAVTRRATYKAEEAITKLEDGKRQQDELIDKLNENLKRELEQLSLHEAQLLSQHRETDAAASTLAEAHAEMEAIQFEKKGLLGQWKTALLGIQRRDEALQATEEALRKQREQEVAIDSEMSGIRKAIRAAEERHEQLSATASKLEAEIRTVDAAVDGCRERQRAAEEKFALLTRSLEQTEGEIGKIEAEEKSLRGEANVLEQQREKVDNATKKLEEAVLSTLGEQMAVEKGTVNTASATEKLRAQAAARQLDEANMRNELARIRVDKLNVASHNAQLETQLKGLNEELAEKDALMAKYELEARRRNVEIEKKQHELDLLNRKFDGLMKQRAGVAELDEDAGPLEATIVSLKKEILAKSTESTELQRVWIKQQTEMVSVHNSNLKLGEEHHDLRARLSILEQKKLRIEARFAEQHKEIADIERQTGGLHIEMAKINRLVSENQQKQVSLADDNYLMETGFVDQLKEKEAEAVALEGKIVALKEEKERLLLDVSEAEKQIMLLDKKIALEKETQAALDPETGAAESKAMQREIHRMRLRYAQLQRRQEMMITDMERAVYKRDNIEAKGSVLAKKTGAAAPTRAELQKTLGELKNKLKMTTHDANVCQMQVSRLQEAQSERGEKVEAARAEVEAVRNQLAIVTNEIREQQFQHRAMAPAIRRSETLARKLVAAAEGTYHPSQTQAELSEQLAQGEEMAARLLTVADSLGQEFPRVAPRIAGVVQQAGAAAQLVGATS